MYFYHFAVQLQITRIDTAIPYNQLQQQKSYTFKWTESVCINVCRRIISARKMYYLSPAAAAAAAAVVTIYGTIYQP